MDENNNNEKEFTVDIDKEELKNQTKDTVNQVKETIKNVDFKKDANATKGFVLEMVKKPFTTIKDVVTEKENRFSFAVILMIVFMVLEGVEYLARVMFTSYTDFKIGYFVTNIASPLLYVLAFTAAVVVFGGRGKKSITTILSGLTIAHVPVILSYVVSIIYDIVSVKVVGYISGIVSSTTNFLMIALTFIAIDGLIESSGDDDKNFRKVAVIAGCAYILLKILSICGVY